MSDLMNKQERIAYELSWCEAELTNISNGMNSNYTQEYINGAISTLRFIIGLESEKVYL